MASLLPTVHFDEHLARFLLLTLALTVLLTGFQILGHVFVAALLSIALLVLYTSVQGFWYGYLEGKLKAAK